MGSVVVETVEREQAERELAEARERLGDLDAAEARAQVGLLEAEDYRMLRRAQDLLWLFEE